MTREELYTEIAKVLQLDRSEVTDDLSLQDSGWDSLAQVSALLVLDQYGKKKVQAKQLEECKTVGDLVRLAESG